ncbi:Tubby-related protein 4 [Sarcoptes scabiei]|uniref:Tubby-related protein 4 n=1 Tax=Sarcoptes scabiei TaxID=52283 RepID=A0A834RFM3_SARSC|nr:Tubby-related protein 4 [Sarcoptes scabiei]
MFVRFERIEHPQSYNDNPITSLSWMINAENQMANTNWAIDDDDDEDDDNGNNFDSNSNQRATESIDHDRRNGPNSSFRTNHQYGNDRERIESDSNLNRTNDSYRNRFDRNIDSNNNDLDQNAHNRIDENNNNNERGAELSEIVSRLDSISNDVNHRQRYECNLDGWLAIGNQKGVVGISYTNIDFYRDQYQQYCRKKLIKRLQQNYCSDPDQNQTISSDTERIFPIRTNYNLRGHRAEIVLVRWNEPYQKLATCDRNGVIFVWIKYEGRWSIELINDRNTIVIDFAWSHDGRMASICYQDGFVLVGSVTGQRYWSSMLNLSECSITCGVWTLNNQYVLFGTSNGHILVISVHGVFITQISLQENVEINRMLWSSMRVLNREQNNSRNSATLSASSYSIRNTQNNNNNNNNDNNNNQNNKSENQQQMLAVSFVDGTIYLMRNYDEVFPYIIETSLLNIKIEWSLSGKILAVGGHRINRIANKNFIYNNIVRFYSNDGTLIKQINLDFNQQPLSALAWALNDRRLFIACGQLLYVAWIFNGLPSLTFFSGLQVFNHLRDESSIGKLQAPEPIQNLLRELFTSTIRCNLPKSSQIDEFVLRPPKNNDRLYCTLIKQNDPIESATSDTIYTLYLEYLGGLIPILKGKRSSRLKPEFVIFNPKLSSRNLEQSMDREKNSSIRTINSLENIEINSNECHDLSTNANLQVMMMNGLERGLPLTTSDSETEESFVSQYLTPKFRRRFRRSQRTLFLRSSSQPIENQEIFNNLIPIESDRQQKKQERKRTSLISNELPETERIVMITSNIWGTKFRFNSLTKKLPSYLGSITYKTSLLHLQPRQMSLKIKELNENNTFLDFDREDFDPKESNRLSALIDENDTNASNRINNNRRIIPIPSPMISSSSDSESEDFLEYYHRNHLVERKSITVVPIRNSLRSKRNSMLCDQNRERENRINLNNQQNLLEQNVEIYDRVQQLTEEHQRQQSSIDFHHDRRPIDSNDLGSESSNVSLHQRFNNLFAEEFLTLKINQNLYDGENDDDDVEQNFDRENAIEKTNPKRKSSQTLDYDLEIKPSSSTTLSTIGDRSSSSSSSSSQQQQRQQLQPCQVNEWLT